MFTTVQGADDRFDSSWVRQLLVSLVTIKVFGIILIFDVAGLQAFDLPKSLFSRATEWLLIGALVVGFLLYGPAIIPRTRLHLAVAGFLLANAAASIVAANQYIALYGDVDRYLGLTFVIDMAVLYAATAVAYRKLEDWALLGAGIAIASVLVIAYAAVQDIGRDPVSWAMPPESRPFSTFGNPDFLGQYLSVLFGLGLAATMIGNGLPLLLRVASAVGALVVLAAAVATGTRGTLIAFPAVIVVALLVHARIHESWRSVIAAATVVILSVAWLGGLLTLTPLGERMQFEARAGGIRERLLLYEAAARAFGDRPLLGYGPDNFGVAHPLYNRQPDPGAAFTSVSPQNAAHSWPLQAAATTGIVGTLSLCILIGASTWSLWTTGLQSGRLIAAAALLAATAYWVEGLVTVGTIGVDWLPWVVYGIAASLGGSWHSSTWRPGSSRNIVIAGAVVACSVGAFSGFGALLANRDAGIARAYANAQPDVAVVAAVSAVRRDSGRAEYWSWLGAGLEAQESWDASADAYLEAATRAPHDWHYWAAVARTRLRESQTGDGAARGEALAAANRAVSVAPNDLQPHTVLSETAYALGEYDLALQTAIGAITRHPATNRDLFVAKAAALANQQTAKLLLQQALALRDTAALHLALAHVCYRLGDRSAARIEATRTLDLEPGNAEALRILNATSP